MKRLWLVIPAMLVGSILLGTTESASAKKLRRKLPKPTSDVDFAFDGTPEETKVELGKLLFFDTRLSGDASVACSTCHEPDQGWGFSNDISRGYPGTIHWRNSQTVVNAAYYGKLFWAGAAKSLEGQGPAAAKGVVHRRRVVDWQTSMTRPTQPSATRMLAQKLNSGPK